jgi:hypothetical protein
MKKCNAAYDKWRKSLYRDLQLIFTKSESYHTLQTLIKIRSKSNWFKKSSFFLPFWHSNLWMCDRFQLFMFHNYSDMILHLNLFSTRPYSTKRTCKVLMEPNAARLYSHISRHTDRWDHNILSYFFFKVKIVII